MLSVSKVAVAIAFLALFSINLQAQEKKNGKEESQESSMQEKKPKKMKASEVLKQILKDLDMIKSNLMDLKKETAQNAEKIDILLKEGEFSAQETPAPTDQQREEFKQNPPDLEEVPPPSSEEEVSLYQNTLPESFYDQYQASPNQYGPPESVSQNAHQIPSPLPPEAYAQNPEYPLPQQAPGYEPNPYEERM